MAARDGTGLVIVWDVLIQNNAKHGPRVVSAHCVCNTKVPAQFGTIKAQLSGGLFRQSSSYFMVKTFWIEETGHAGEFTGSGGSGWSNLPVRAPKKLFEILSPPPPPHRSC